MPRGNLKKTAPSASVRGLDLRVALLAGAGANTNMAVAGIKRSDVILSAIELPASAAATDRTSVVSITSDGNVQSTAALTGNQLLLIWAKGR